MLCPLACVPSALPLFLPSLPSPPFSSYHGSYYGGSRADASYAGSYGGSYHGGTGGLPQRVRLPATPANTPVHCTAGCHMVHTTSRAWVNAMPISPQFRRLL